MAATKSQVQSLPADDQQKLQSWLDALQTSWSNQRLSAIVALLPESGDPLRPVALSEIVKADMSQQWQSGQEVRLEAYLDTYPELGTTDTVPAELVHAEYAARRQAGHSPDINELGVRFPAQAEVLKSLVEADVAPATPSVEEQTRASVETESSRVSTHSELKTPIAAQELPAEFGRYRVEQKLGQGAMGAVYLARDTELGRKVALKVPKFSETERPKLIERFYREARAAATLRNQHICPVYDVGEIDGIRFISMAYIEGKPMSAYIHPDKLQSPRQVALVMRKLAKALDEAHTAGIIHRDLKPANIMFDKKREPIIMDFGLARQVDQDTDQSRLTQEGTVIGTPAYMAPEQVKANLDQMGPPTDVYSLGIILYELLTGRLPFEGPIAAVLGQVLTVDAEPPSTINAEVDPGLEEICLKAISKEIVDRYQTMGEFADAFTEWLRSPAAAAGTKRGLRAAVSDTGQGEEAEIFQTAVGETESPRTWSLPSRPPGKRRKPDAKGWGTIPPTKRWLIGGAGAAALLLLGVIIVITTKEGTVEIDTQGKPTKVTINDGKVTIDTTQDEQQKSPVVSGASAQKEEEFYARTSVGIPHKLGFCIDAAFEGDPSISSDGLELFFHGTDRGGPGGSDLFVARRQSISEPFGEPVALRFANSPAGDWAPFVSPDGLNLVFASARAGNHDIFLTQRTELGTHFGKATPLGAVNSKVIETEPAISSDGRTLFIARQEDETPNKEILATLLRARLSRRQEVMDVNSTNLPGHAMPILVGTHGSLILSMTDAGKRDRGTAGLYATWTEGNPDKYISPVHIADIGNAVYNAYASLMADGRVIFYAQGKGIYSMRLADETAETIRRVLAWKPGDPPPIREDASQETGSGPPPAKAPFNAKDARQHQERWAKHLGIPVETENSIGLKLVLIPAGKFLMGSSDAQIENFLKQQREERHENWYRDHIRAETPQHSVDVAAPIYVGIHEVTQREYEEVTGSNPSDNARNAGDVGLASFPVDNVTWFDCANFCNALSVKEGLPPYYQGLGNNVSIVGGIGYRLPTEAEWEFACRAGSSQKYFFGNDDSLQSQYGWCAPDARDRKYPVAQKKMNPFGLFDVYGNVWERCGSVYVTYSMDIDGKNPASRITATDDVVNRGGGALNRRAECRSAHRSYGPANARSRQLGFRVVRTIEITTKKLAGAPKPKPRTANPTPRPTPAKTAAIIGRSPDDVARRRREYLEQHLKPLLEGKQEDIPESKYAAQFPPKKRISLARSKGRLEKRYFTKMDCRQAMLEAKVTEGKVPYCIGTFDADDRLVRVEAVDQNGGLRIGSLGSAVADYRYDDDGNRIQEIYRDTTGKKLTENNQLVMIARHAYEKGERVETRFYDIKRKPAEDSLGVHRRLYKGGKSWLEYRLDGSHRERWLEPLNLGKRINKSYARMSAVTADGKEMYFSSLDDRLARTVWLGDRWSDLQPVLSGSNQLRGLRVAISSDKQVLVVGAPKKIPGTGFAIFVTERRNGQWQDLRNAGPQINKLNVEGGAAFIPETHTLCVSTTQGSGNFWTTATLWLCKRERDVWGAPRPINIGPALTPSFSFDGKRLFFASSRKGSKGNNDIWVTHKEGNGWSHPINLGTEVNNKLDEGAGTPSPDGTILYFSRDWGAWNLWVTGRTDSEVAIRHMAEIYGLGEWEVEGPPVDTPSLENAKSISDLPHYRSLSPGFAVKTPTKQPPKKKPRTVTYTFKDIASVEKFRPNTRYRFVSRNNDTGLEFLPAVKGVSEAKTIATSPDEFSFPITVDFYAACRPDDKGRVFDFWPGLFGLDGIRFFWGDDFNAHSHVAINGKHEKCRHIDIVRNTLHHVRFDIDQNRKLTITIDDAKWPLYETIIPEDVDLSGPVVLGGGAGHVIYNKVVVTTR